MENHSNRTRIAMLSRPRDTHSPSERMRMDAAFFVHSGFNSKMTEGSTAHARSSRLNTRMPMMIGSPGVTLTNKRPVRKLDQKIVRTEVARAGHSQSGV